MTVILPTLSAAQALVAALRANGMQACYGTLPGNQGVRVIYGTIA